MFGFQSSRQVPEFADRNLAALEEIDKATHPRGSRLTANVEGFLL
jgi:hypothetical protein